MLEQHRQDPNCAACHELMDPIGLAFEHFDAIGRWREQDGGQAIDASGTLSDGERDQTVSVRLDRCSQANSLGSSRER